MGTRHKTAQNLNAERRRPNPKPTTWCGRTRPGEEIWVRVNVSNQNRFFAPRVRHYSIPEPMGELL